MRATARERVDRALSPPAVYRLVDGRALLESGDRGWPETVVATDPVDSFRYRRPTHRPDGREPTGRAGPDDTDADETDRDGGFERLRAWLRDNDVALGGTATDAAATAEWRSATAAGAIGYLGYDLAAELETLPGETVRDIDLPDAAFDCYDVVVRVGSDHCVVEGVAHERAPAPVEQRVATLADRLRTGAVPAGAGDVTVTGLTSNFERAAYLDAVERVKARIREGDTFQANVSQRLAFDCAAEPIDLYATLRAANPAPYMGLLEYDGGAVVSTSPELLLAKEGRELRTRPIAGTRARRTDADADAALRADLTASEKERAEHSILVDLVRNDLGTVATYGSVTVDEFLTVEPYAAVQHLESVVTGELRAEADLVDAVQAVFPGGTVTGAPKPRTLAIIDAVEPTERGPYTGSMGWIGFDGDATLNMLIRTVVLDGDRGYLQVGGGVVHDSEPAREYTETLEKATAMVAALDLDAETASRVADGRERAGGAGADDEPTDLAASLAALARDAMTGAGSGAETGAGTELDPGSTEQGADADGDGGGERR